MTIKHVKTLLLCIALSTSSILFTTATSQELPANTADRFFIQLESDRLIRICEFQASEQPICKTAELPASVGSAQKVVSGPFVDAAKASWMVFSTESISLCAIHPTGITWSCQRLSEAPGAERMSMQSSRSVNRVEANGEDTASREQGELISKNFTSAQQKLEDIMHTNAICDSDQMFEGHDICTNNIPVVIIPGTRPPSPALPGMPPIFVPGGPINPPGPGAGTDPGPIDTPIGVSPEKARCEASCNTIYTKVDAPRCRNMPFPAQIKAICWAAAATKLGVCISKC